MGRTHGVHAEPTTFGLKLAGWAFALDRDRLRIEHALDGLRVGKLSGAVGQYAAIDPEVERIACERLGLEPAPSSTQILQRDRHAELLSALALVGSSLERFALEIRHLARTEVREVEEPFGRGQKGSSAMPHKRNPIVSERICGLARVLRANARSVSRTSRSGTSGTSRTRRPSGSCCRTRSSPSTTCSIGSPGSSRGWSCVRSACARTSSRATGCSSASGCYSRWSRAASRGTSPTGWCSGTRCARGRRSSTSASSSAPTPRSSARVDLDEVFDLGAYTTHVDTVFERLRALVAARGRRPCLRPCISAAGRSARSTRSATTELLLVASDRISTFDVVLPTEIPDKGRVLTGLSVFWFARTRDIVGNHLARAAPDGRSLECRRLEMLPVEFVVRGYLAGSGWVEYRETGSICGHQLPAGLVEADRLPEPIVTPATKAIEGHDLNITEPEAEELCGRDAYRAARDAALALYRFARRPHAGSAGLLLADTKFEFGLDADGYVTLGDEALTPDSSRFWPADGVRARRTAAVVRQAVRARLVPRNRVGPDAARARPCPTTSSPGTRARYVEAFER